jgi:insertion element IS1 protein InsB
MAIGSRTKATARKLWASMPPVYRQYAVCYTDFWDAYAAILPSKRHRAVGKESGQTSHIERRAIPYANAVAVWCAKRSRSRKSWPTTSVPFGTTSTTITHGNAPNLVSLLMHDYLEILSVQTISARKPNRSLKISKRNLLPLELISATWSS